MNAFVSLFPFANLKGERSYKNCAYLIIDKRRSIVYGASFWQKETYINKTLLIGLFDAQGIPIHTKSFCVLLPGWFIQK